MLDTSRTPTLHVTRASELGSNCRASQCPSVGGSESGVAGSAPGAGTSVASRSGPTPTVVLSGAEEASEVDGSAAGLETEAGIGAAGNVEDSGVDGPGAELGGCRGAGSRGGLEGCSGRSGLVAGVVGRGGRPLRRRPWQARVRRCRSRRCSGASAVYRGRRWPRRHWPSRPRGPRCRSGRRGWAPRPGGCPGGGCGCGGPRRACCPRRWRRRCRCRSRRCRWRRRSKHRRSSRCRWRGCRQTWTPSRGGRGRGRWTDPSCPSYLSRTTRCRPGPMTRVRRGRCSTHRARRTPPAGRADPLAGHLHQAKRGDLGHLVLGPVPGQALQQQAQHQLAVALQHHVDEVNDDDAADVAQPELADDLLGRFEVVPGDRLFQVAALASELARVDVDDGHRLGAVDDQRPAARQPDLALQRLGQLLVDAVLGEHVAAVRRLPAVSRSARCGAT